MRTRSGYTRHDVAMIAVGDRRDAPTPVPSQ